ncbi:NAD(P)-dependent oxidoreductase [Luteimonas viscosa]|uniref:NAD(P)-dependent oxidoreductase n=1 Tax=Luteimonas viscosa TaxID=1132694 RepID=A0A5D4XJU9_9GAMM|nr:NAD(P)-dependent oxidoreductase [Luteimonas viscosa]TYT24799.1 NAD(P)-dependent oxidoreductase [Luteimonas viscosa]
MRVILIGSSGRIGRAVFSALTRDHSVLGIDHSPFATTRIVGDFTDPAVVSRAMDGAEAVILTAALHAPHVGIVSDAEFERINVEGTARLIDATRASGVRRIVFTSTTALYGRAIVKGRCTWVDEDTPPQPESIYHRTKLAAENLLEDAATGGLAVRILRMSRCFPQTADVMAAYRLHRGIDARDVADAHRLALENDGDAFERYVVSGSTPFEPGDCDALATDPAAVIEQRVPALAGLFRTRGWHLPSAIDRVYAPRLAERRLVWKATYGFEEVVAQLDRRSLEVLPVGADVAERAE